MFRGFYPWKFDQFYLWFCQELAFVAGLSAQRAEAADAGGATHQGRVMKTMGKPWENHGEIHGKTISQKSCLKCPSIARKHGGFKCLEQQIVEIAGKIVPSSSSHGGSSSH